MDKIKEEKRLPGFSGKQSGEESGDILEELSMKKFLSLLCNEGARGVNIVLELLYPKPDKIAFTIDKVDLEIDGNGAVIVGFELINENNKSIFFSIAQNVVYYFNQKELNCDKCDLNGVIGSGCVFALIGQDNICPCTVYLVSSDNELSAVIDSKIPEV